MSAFLAVGTYLTLVVLLVLVVNRGFGPATPGLRELALFLVEKAPGPLNDLFEEDEGLASRIWMMSGGVWLFVSSSFAFIALWQEQNPDALKAFAGFGYTYDLETMRQIVWTSMTMGAATMLLLGGVYHIVERLYGRPLVGQRLVALMGVVWILLTIVEIGLAFTAFSANQIPLSGHEALQALRLVVVIPCFLAVGLTIDGRSSGEIGPIGWHILLAFCGLIWALCAATLRPVFDSVELAWMIGKAVEGWWLTGLAFATLLYVIPAGGSGRIWSRSLASAGYVGLALTIVPFGSHTTIPSTISSPLRALVLSSMALSLLPLTAVTLNILASVSRSKNADGSIGSYSSSVMLGSVGTCILLFSAFGSMFTSGNAFGGTEDLGVINDVADRAFLFGGLGLVMCAVGTSIWPRSVGREPYSTSRHRTILGLFSIGIVGATAVGVGVGIAVRALTASGFDGDPMQVDGVRGAIMTEAFFFYGAVIGSIALAMNMITTSYRGRVYDISSEISSQEVEVFRQQIPAGRHTMRGFLSMGLSLDTVLDFNPKAALPPSGRSVVNVILEDDDEEPPLDPELVQLAHSIHFTRMSVYELFRDLDLDGDGSLTPYEFREGMMRMDIDDLAPGDVDRLIRAVDINGDGRIDLPELDIMISRAMREHPLDAEQDLRLMSRTQMENRIKTMEEERKSTEQRLKTLGAEQKSAKKKLKALENKLADADSGSKKDKDALSALSTKVDEAKVAAKEIATEMKSEQSSLDGLSVELDDTSSRLTEVKEAMKAAQIEKKDAQVLMNNLQSELKEAHATITSLGGKQPASTIPLEEELKKLKKSDLQTLAKSLELSASGTKDQIIERINAQR